MNAAAFFFRTGRIPCLAAVHIFFFAVVIGIDLLYFHNASLLRRARAYVTMSWARVVCAILGVHVRREGCYRTIPCNFTVSNHVSYIDILVLAGIRPSVFIAKQEVKHWPLIGWFARRAGTIFIDRASKISAWNVLSDIEKAVADNINVVVFPEGTTTDGSGLLALHAFECIKDGLAKQASLISQELGGPLCKGRSGAFPEIQITEKGLVDELAD